MDIQTEAVAETVTEVLPVSGFRDDSSGSVVDFAARDSGSAGSDACQLCLQNNVVNLLHLVRRFTERDSACHVTAVPVPQTAEIHGDEVTQLKDGVPGYAVGLAGVPTGDDDGVEGIALTAVSEHPIDQFGGNFLLGHAGANDLQCLFQGFFADPLCGDHAAQFLLVLGGPQLFHQCAGRLQIHSEQPLKIYILGVAEFPVFSCEGRKFLAVENLAEQAHLGMRVVKKQYLGTAACHRLCRLDIARIGNQPGFFPGDQDKAVRKRKTRGIALVFFVSQQNGAETVRDQFVLDLHNVVHIPVSSDVGRGKLTIKTEPCGLLFPTRILPPQAATASCTMLRPRPLPPLWRDLALSTR